MAIKHGTCNCGEGLATETVTIMVSVWGKREAREITMCRRCKEATEANGLAVTSAPSVAEPEVFSREYHVAKVDAAASQVRKVVADWFETGDDSEVVRRLAGQMLLISRNLAADLAAISAIDYATYNRTLP